MRKALHEQMFSAVPPITDIRGGRAVRLHGSEGNVFHSITAHSANKKSRRQIKKSPLAQIRCHSPRFWLGSFGPMTVIAMSRTEIDRMSVLQDLAANRIKVTEAATLMSLGRRQVFRLAKAYAQRGPEALVSRRRGRPSNRAYPGDLRDMATGIIRERYPDFGPTLAAEKLAELHDIHLARETVRQWMITAGLWKDRRARLKAVHQPRYRRDCLGELIQIDGSEHWWFEARGPQCTLLVFIDDATSRLMHLQFVESESTFDYFAATRAYLERYGKPVALYSDKHGVFRVNRKDAIGVTA